jgi:serine/threonine-protein phosphatase 2A regulatory subunit B'
VSSFSFQDLPLLSDVQLVDREQLFIRKLRLCSFVFEFEPEPKAPPAADGITAVVAPPVVHRPDPFASEKEIKRQALLELVDYLNKTKAAFSEAALAEMFEMISVNLLRPLRPASVELGVWDPEEDEPVRCSVHHFLLSDFFFFFRSLKIMLRCSGVGTSVAAPADCLRVLLAFHHLHRH